MLNSRVFEEVKTWKKPFHVLRAYSAKSYLKTLPNLEIIGITGSVGKTLTQNAIVAVLSQKYRVVSGNENLDPTFRIPKTILDAKPWDNKMVLEYGVEHPGDMDHYLWLAKPKYAVITTIASTHLQYFQNTEGVYDEKSKLVKSLPKSAHAILNADDPYSHKMAKETKAKVWWYGQKSKTGVKISHFAQSLKGSSFRLHYGGQKATVKWRVLGKHQLLSAYAAATVGLANGITLKQIAKGLTLVKPPEHRLNPIVTKSANILDDSYNASPKAMQESIKTLVEIGKNKKKIAVLGQMKDLGTHSEQAHRQIGEKLAKTSINYLLTIGKVAAEIGISAKKSKFKGKIISVADTKAALKELAKIAKPKTVVLVKGSRHEHLERVVNGLLGKSTHINCYHCGRLD